MLKLVSDDATVRVDGRGDATVVARTAVGAAAAVDVPTLATPFPFLAETIHVSASVAFGNFLYVAPGKPETCAVHSSLYSESVNGD